MIRNFRDFSIYTNKEGKKIKEGKFLRSATLYKLKKKDIKKLHSYGELSVIDLRLPGEREEKPDVRFDQYYPISLLSDAVVGMSHEKKTELDMASQIPDMEELYGGLVDDPHSVEGMREVFKIICDEKREGTILWHCTEGKDRCGMVSAIFLKMLDFDDEVIMKDYLKSLKSSGRKGRILSLLVLVIKRDRKMAKSVKDAFWVKESYLKAAFDGIDMTYGSFDEFLKVIGIDENMKASMKERYLEE